MLEFRFRVGLLPHRYRIGNTAGPEESLQGGGSDVRAHGRCRIGTFINQQTQSIVSADYTPPCHGCHSSGIHDRVVSTNICHNCLNIGVFIRDGWSLIAMRMTFLNLHENEKTSDFNIFVLSPAWYLNTIVSINQMCVLFAYAFILIHSDVICYVTCSDRVHIAQTWNCKHWRWYALRWE